MRNARTLASFAFLVTAAAAAPVFAQAPAASDLPARPGIRPSRSQLRPGASGSPGASASAPATSPKATVPVETPSGPGKGIADVKGLPQFEETMEFEPRSPNYKVSFSLEDADLAELVRVIGQLTGKRFIFGGKVKNIKATVYSPQKVTVAEAYQAFLSILETNGLTVVPHGRFLKIIETTGAQSQGTPVYGTKSTGTTEERYITRIHRMGHVSADDAANVLSKFKSKEAEIAVYAPGNMLIITDTGSNIKRMLSLLEEIDTGGAGDQIWIEPIHYAAASDIASRVNELFDVKAGGASSPAPTQAAGGRAGRPAAPATVEPSGPGDRGSGDLHVAKLVSDDRTNSLIIVSTERAYLRILELVKKLDVPQTGEGEIHVLALQHADAVELTKTLNEIITGSSAAGTAPQGGRGGRPGGAAPTTPADSGIFEGGVKVSADKATNSIVITSSLRDFGSLRAVVDRLDRSRRQVFIEAAILDLQLQRSNILGTSFHGGVPNSPTDGSVIYGGNKVLNTISPAPLDSDALQGLALGVRGQNLSGNSGLLGTGVSLPAFGALLFAVAKTGDSDVLATPHILATDNVKAEINVGENAPLQTNATTSIASLAGLAGGAGAGAAGALGGLGGLGSFGVPRADLGTKITITPHLNESNQVRLELAEEISERGAPLDGSAGAIPVTKRNATTQLTVEDQQTVVIGGLIRNVVSRGEEKVPVLGDIPVLGALFRKRTDSMQKRNLVLILTPYIVRDQADLRAIFERKMQERQDFLDRYFVFSDNDYRPPRDYARANGLVEEIRQAGFQVEERKKLDELTKPRELKSHDPGRPLEMPTPIRSQTQPSAPPPSPPGGTAPVTPPPANPLPTNGEAPPPPNLRVNPPVRNLDRVER